ncbi:hypothetical protein M405DRAFT_575897 [Rhizopogon salebrosus TDB-379]|nr:hypothetical protein M405DRAFT_575897 [Rhizopogon salebrosus TDB-379]
MLSPSGFYPPVYVRYPLRSSIRLPSTDLHLSAFSPFFNASYPAWTSYRPTFTLTRITSLFCKHQNTLLIFFLTFIAQFTSLGSLEKKCEDNNSRSCFCLSDISAFLISQGVLV